MLYNDVYRTVLNDTEQIARHLSMEYKGYIHGDLKAIIDYSIKNNYTIDAIISSEVIEHIYDIPTFIEDLNTIPSKQLSFVF